MAAASPVPAPYAPNPYPPLPDSVPTWLRREFAAIQRTLDGVLDFLPRDAAEAPKNARSGMIRRAVSPWRPVVGQTADRWVQFDGTAWSYLT